MVRNILGAVAGYFLIFVVMFILCTAAYLVMGADMAFSPEGYDVSMTWIVVSTVFSFIASVVGGYMAAAIGRGATAVKILAGIVLVLGLLMAASIAVAPSPPEARTAETASLQAMAKARTPLWAAVLSPLVAVAGVMVGGGMRKNR